MAQFNQTLHRLTVGEEIINEQHMLARIEEPLGHDDRELALLGERVHLRDILVAVKVDGLRLLGKHDRHIAEMTRRDTRDTDAGSLDGQDFVDLFAGEQPRPFLSHVVEQLDITLMVEERVHFEDVTRFDDAVTANTLFEFFHDLPHVLWGSLCSGLSHCLDCGTTVITDGEKTPREVEHVMQRAYRERRTSARQ